MPAKTTKTDKDTHTDYVTALARAEALAQQRAAVYAQRCDRSWPRFSGSRTGEGTGVAHGVLVHDEHRRLDAELAQQERALLQQEIEARRQAMDLHLGVVHAARDALIAKLDAARQAEHEALAGLRALAERVQPDALEARARTGRVETDPNIEHVLREHARALETIVEESR